MGLKDERFTNVMQNWWEGINVHGSTSFLLVEKLKVLKGFLKVWNKNVFGNLELKKIEALNQVAAWDVVESSRPLIPDEFGIREEAKDNFKKRATMEEVF